MRLPLLIVIACLFVPVLSISTAAEDRIVGLKSLTTKKVDSQSRRATIDLSATSQHFRGFRLKAGAMRGRSRLTIRRVTVYYDDGRVYRTRRRIRLRPGQRSDLIDRRREGRFVDRIELEFIRTRNSGFQEIEVLGLQSLYDQRARRGGAPVSANGVAASSAETRSENGSPVVGQSAVIDRAGEPPAASAGVAQPESLRPEKMEPPLPSRVASGDTQPAGDVLFGVHYVGFGLDKDVIEVGRKVGKFARVRLRVLDNDIFLENFKLHFAGGGAQDFQVGEKIIRGTQTAWFDIERNAFVDRIELSYRSRPDFRGRARVEVFGEHAKGWLDPKGEGRRYNDGWVLLGAQSAGFVGFDNDTIPVRQNPGGFRKLRIAVRDRAITLGEIRVIYRDGQQDVIPVDTRVDAGKSYGPISLQSPGKQIEKISTLYRSRFIDKKAKNFATAVVEVWAQHD